MYFFIYDNDNDNDNNSVYNIAWYNNDICYDIWLRQPSDLQSVSKFANVRVYDCTFETLRESGSQRLIGLGLVYDFIQGFVWNTA